jgi:hypothetical protein
MISKLSACAGLEVFGLQASICPSSPAGKLPGMGAGEPHGREIQKNCGQPLGYSPQVCLRSVEPALTSRSAGVEALGDVCAFDCPQAGQCVTRLVQAMGEWQWRAGQTMTAFQSA